MSTIINSLQYASLVTIFLRHLQFCSNTTIAQPPHLPTCHALYAHLLCARQVTKADSQITASFKALRPHPFTMARQPPASRTHIPVSVEEAH